MHQNQVVPQVLPVPTFAFVQQAPKLCGVRPWYASKASAILGGLQVAIGVLCIAFQFGGMAMGAAASYLVTGLWTGLLVSHTHCLSLIDITN